MNYQVASFWFYSGRAILMVMIALGLALFGATAAIFYGLLIGLVFPIAVSIRLHQLAEKGLAVIPKQASHWTVYVQGIPVQETRNYLTNPCFALQSHLRTFFLRAFVIKVMMQIALVLLLIRQLWLMPSLWVAIAGGLVGLWLVYRCANSIAALNAVIKPGWQTEQITTQNETLWYRAGFGQQTTALERLLSF